MVILDLIFKTMALKKIRCCPR